MIAIQQERMDSTMPFWVAKIQSNIGCYALK